MPPSRRTLLRAGAAAIGGLAGCSAGLEPGAPATNEAEQREGATASPTASSDQTATPAARPALRCDAGPLPDDGWPLPDRSSGRTNYTAAATGPTEPPTAAWSITPPEPELGDNAFTRPVVAGGRLYVGRRIQVGANQPSPDEHYVHAYETSSGDGLWQAPVPREPNVPAITAAAVVVDDDARLYAHDPETGTETWSTAPAGGVKDILPTPAGLLVTSWRAKPDHRLVAFDTDGRERWDVTLPGAASSAPAWVDGLAFVVTADGALVAVDTDEAAVAWIRNLQDGDDTVPGSVIATTCAEFAAIDGVLYAVDRAGDLGWSASLGVRGLATDGETVFGVGPDGTVSAVTADGTDQWERSLGIEDPGYTDGFYDDPAVDGETLYAGSLDHRLFAVATADGTDRWSVELDWRRPAEVTLVDDTLFAAGGSHLAAFR